MNSKEALEHCQAYLDRELDPETAARVEACLAQDPNVAEAFEAERKFHAFLKSRSAQAAVPNQFAENLKARLVNERAPRTMPPRPRRFSRTGWWLAAAGLMTAAGLGAYMALSTPECPYMVACATAHDAVATGKNPLQIQSQDRAQLAAFVAAKLKIELGGIPALSEHKLTATGAGISGFESLKQYGSPNAAFIVYSAPAGDPVTFFIHPWAEEEPEPFNKTQYQGKTYWSATHGHQAIATWKSSDDKLVLSIVSSRSKEETLRIAEEARRAISAQATKHAVLNAGISPASAEFIFGLSAVELSALQ